jgi:hypothetical protein
LLGLGLSTGLRSCTLKDGLLRVILKAFQQPDVLVNNARLLTDFFGSVACTQQVSWHTGSTLERDTGVVEVIISVHVHSLGIGDWSSHQ